MEASTHIAQPEKRRASVMRVVPRVLDVAPAGTVGFAALKPVVAAMLRDFFESGRHGGFVTRFGSEIVFLFPKLAARAEFEHAPDLAAIAIPPSRRRLHKESEQIFRITQAIVHIVLRWARDFCPSGLRLTFHDLATIDEQSLRVLVRLASCVRSNVTLRATKGGLIDDDLRSSSLSGLLHRREMRRELLRIIEQRVGLAVTFPRFTNLSVPSEDVDWGSTIEAQRTRAFEEALATRDPGVVGPALVAALEAAVFTQNNDHAQWLVEQALPIFPLLARKDRREVVLHLGMVHAFTLDFERALTAMETSFGLADSALERAESRFFVALLLTKRLDRPKEGRAAIDEALSHLEELSSAEACVERAWLYNLRALSFVAEKNLAEARACCKQVLANLKGAEHSPDATHIKINVVSNITVLDEHAKDLDGAIARWSFFEPYLANAGPVFGKHYLFRKGGLLAKAKRFSQAKRALEACYRLAERTKDVFYGDVIAQGVAALHFREGDAGNAAWWFERSLEAKFELLQDDDRARVMLAYAACLAQTSDVRAPIVLAAIDADTDARLASGVAAIRAGRALPPEVEAWAMALPATKLNRPFHATSLY